MPKAHRKGIVRNAFLIFLHRSGASCEWKDKYVKFFSCFVWNTHIFAPQNMTWPVFLPVLMKVRA